MLPILKNMSKEQRRSGKLLAGFFSLVLVFTVVSRGLDAFTVATVDTVTPTTGALGRTITVEGTIQPLSEVAVAVPEGFLVQRTMVEEGSWVQEGDVLAVLDMDNIQRQLAETRRSLETAQLNAAMKNVKAEVIEADSSETNELRLERAREDLKTVKRNNDENVERARFALAEVRHKRNKLYETGYESEEMEAYEKEISQLEDAYEQVCQAAERALLDAERAVEDAKLAIIEAQREAANKQAQSDAESQTSNLESRVSALSVAEVQEKIARLESLVENEGRILASVNGVITKSNIETGSVTGSSGAFILGEQEEGALFRGTVNEDSGKRLARGDNVDLTLPGHSKVLPARIDSLSPPKEKGGDYTVTVRLEGVEADPGTAATLTAQKKGDKQGTVLPLSALHSDNNDPTSGYVYILREANTTMGAQTVVEKIPVIILDRNDQSALVEAPLTREDKVVTGSSRPLNLGDRVREGTV